MKTDEKNKQMNLFDKKIAQIFQETFPTMPDLPEEQEGWSEILELDRECLDQLQAAGETLSTDIVRFLKNNNRYHGGTV